MKIFISGSRGIKDNLPPTVYQKIEEQIEQGDEFLIGDSDGVDNYIQQFLCNMLCDYVTVYVSGYKDKTRYNEAGWPEEHCPVGVNATRHNYYIEKDFAMAEDADAGIVIWDGKSKGAFINMVNLVFLGKHVDLFLIKEEKWVNINSLEQLKNYVGEESDWTDADAEMVLTHCGFSIEMKEYLISEYVVSDECLVDIISTAPITLKKKSELLTNLLNKRNVKEEVLKCALNGVSYIRGFKNLKKEIRRIINIKLNNSKWTYLWNAFSSINAASGILEYGGVYDECIFNLHAEWYDTDILTVKSSSLGLFRTKDEVFKYIRNEEQENDGDEGWYRIEAWADIDGVLSLVYNFYTIKDEVCWFEKMNPYNDSLGNVYYRAVNGFYSSRFTINNLKTPYKTGDIIHVDCRPFGPSFNAIILEDEHQYDSSYPTILFKIPYTEEWDVTSLKGGRFFKEIECNSFRSPLSALYNIRLIEDEELTLFCEMLSGKEGEEIYRNLCERWDGRDGECKTTEQMREIFGLSR